MRMMLAEQDLETRDRLVMEHVGLVKLLASRLSHRIPSQVEFSELVSVGVVGLIDAAGRYRASTGVPFDAFARRRIQGAMLDALRGLDWAPRSLRKLRRSVDTTMGQLRHTLMREPVEAEIAAALNVSEAEYTKMLDQLRSAELATIRQASVAPDGQTTLDVAVDPSEGAHARLERLELRGQLANAVLELPERERQILALYYEEELTLAEIGQVIGVGESRVSQLRTQAIARLRSHLSASLRPTKH
ncbi:MAG TPA: RNA polymerase sigma factor FliA [Vicinamibacterales bacterium]|jgi:RNA polymerase sigma factor for flagellar operon FliA|nr:RNA polymerase sigma factor FliA [Vicinamibacterales bacterium]